MKVTITLDYWQAVRLKALVEDGLSILDKEDATQRGFDGYTRDDLAALELDQIKDSPSLVCDIHTGKNLFPKK